MTHSIFCQFIRYSLAGLFSNAALFSLYLVLIDFGAGPKLAMTLSYCLGAGIAFSINLVWTFNYIAEIHSAMKKYISMYICGYLLNLLILHVLVDILGLPHEIIQAAAIIGIAISFFLLSRYWVFKPSQR